MSNNRPILTITGSDPAGYTGVQADIKTISTLGGYAVSAVTSITIQNTLGIQEFYDLPAAVVRGQIEAIVNDVEPAVVKIGMIRTQETLDVVVEMLHRYRPRHVVYMPVMRSVQGDWLMTDLLAAQISDRLLPLCTLVIHNTPFDTHGDANLYASAVAHYLNEGCTTEEALQRARQLLDEQPERTGRLRSRSEELYDLFVRELEQSFAVNSDVRYYADKLNVASGYLAQVTRRITGRSPKVIIDERILAEAGRLLTHTTLTIQEIAYRLGFANQAHFSTFFKKNQRISPTQFRRK